MPRDTEAVTQTQTEIVPISGRPLTLPPGPIFHLHKAGQSTHDIGEFRAWAGYKTLGSDAATNDLAHFQHVVSFGATMDAGRTGVHAHMAHCHLVIPTSEIEQAGAGHRRPVDVEFTQEGKAGGDDRQVTVEQQQRRLRRRDDGQCQAEGGIGLFDSVVGSHG